jgi:hypothetical protein
MADKQTSSIDRLQALLAEVDAAKEQARQDAVPSLKTELEALLKHVETLNAQGIGNGILEHPEIKPLLAKLVPMKTKGTRAPMVKLTDTEHGELNKAILDLVKKKKALKKDIIAHCLTVNPKFNKTKVNMALKKLKTDKKVKTEEDKKHTGQGKAANLWFAV